MARSLRIQFPGAWYHVMNRGGSRRTVFRNEDDYRLFLSILGQAHDTYALEVHGYCLMTNHYHLLVRTPRGNLASCMRHVDGVFTQRINRRCNADGALFRGRYCDILIDSDNYLLAVSRYIHLNPVSAAIVDEPGSYVWSSYNAYAGSTAPPSWLYTDSVLNMFNPSSAHDEYHRFVASGVDTELDAFYATESPGPVLGSKDFIQSLAAHQTSEREIPQRKILETPPDIEQVISTVADVFNVSTTELLHARRLNHARMVAICLSRRPGGHPLRRIAEHFGLGHYSSITVTCRRLSSRLQHDQTLAWQYNTALSRLDVYGVKS